MAILKITRGDKNLSKTEDELLLFIKTDDKLLLSVKDSTIQEFFDSSPVRKVLPVGKERESRKFSDILENSKHENHAQRQHPKNHCTLSVTEY